MDTSNGEKLVVDNWTVSGSGHEGLDTSTGGNPAVYNMLSLDMRGWTLVMVQNLHCV